MKKTLAAIALCLTLCNNSLASGIPVVDAASLAQALQEFMMLVQQLEEMKKQLENAEKQLSTAQDTLKTMSDPRQVENLLRTIYTDLEKISGSAILREYGIHEIEGLSGESAEDAQAAIDRASEWLATVKQFQKDTNTRYDELKSLAAKTGVTADIKESMDLNSRINAENAIIANEQLKAMMAGQAAMAKKEMEEQKMLQELRERLNN